MVRENGNYLADRVAEKCELEGQAVALDRI